MITLINDDCLKAMDKLIADGVENMRSHMR